MFHFKTIKLSRESFIVSAAHCKKIFILGASACFNQIAMTVVQIVMNNTLSHYGAQSIYGGDIPLACAGIITKVNMLIICLGNIWKHANAIKDRAEAAPSARR